MVSFLNQIKNIVKTHPDFIEGDLEIKDNNGFRTLYLCDIAVIKLVYLKNKSRIEVAKKFYEIFELQRNLYNIKSKSDWIKIDLNDEVANAIYNCILIVFKKCYKESAEYTFGCCSRFTECSDARKCICNNKHYINNIKRFPSGCMYKDNLDHGLIFYGKNKNYPRVNK